MKNHSAKFTTALVFLFIVMGLISYLVVREYRTKRPEELSLTTAGFVEMCLSCHGDVKLDTAHDAKVVGCSPCHLGDPMSIDKGRAHRDMVLNPGDLRIAEKTCAIEGCHPADIKKVKNSLMATNRGILATLLYYWGEAETQDGDYSIEKLLAGGENSLALDYFRKLCATCHLWKQKYADPDAPLFIQEKGGGCTACHFTLPDGLSPSTVTSFEKTDYVATGEDKKKPHPLIIKKIPDDNCIRCHNRSGRIGLSYTGKYEAEGYGTPYEEGELSSRRLDGNRFYLAPAEDIHHKKGMSCIDCHVRDEIMGNGTGYAHYEEQLEISCEMCHSAAPGTTRKGKPVWNIAEKEGKFVLTGKNDARERPLNPPKPEVCSYAGHRRLTCESCHSTWVPQCYGCHVKKDDRETELDKLTLKETEGNWEEGRSYIRYEKPMLGVWQDRVVIVTPGCQDVVTIINKKGEISGGFNRFTMAAINPHTTQLKGRSCRECHAEPKTVGLGEGTVARENGQWKFYPVDQGIETANGRTVGLDAFVTIEGEPLQHGSRKDLRPFNSEELQRILRVGICLDCHEEYTDPAYIDYDPKRPCPAYSGESEGV